MILKKKLSIKDIFRILNENKEVKQIICSRGAYNHLPKKALRALKVMKIKIKIVDLKRGKKVKHDLKKIEKLASTGLSAFEISRRTNIPLRTVYYHLKNLKYKK